MTLTDARVDEIVSVARTIRGWMSTEELAWLARQAENRLRIVEFGVYQGHSTYALANGTYQGTVYAVDDWRGDHLTPGAPTGDLLELIFIGNLRREVVSGRVRIHRMTTAEFAAQNPHERFDFIFIDAGHDHDAVVEDCRIAQALATPDALIAGHDWHHPGLQAALHEVFPTARLVGGLSNIWSVPA